MVKRLAIVRDSIVENVVLADPETWSPPTGTVAMPEAEAIAAGYSRRSGPRLGIPDQIAQIKAEASARILAVLPDWKQRNMIARSVELLEIREAGEILTAAELRELHAIRAAWSWARAVRSYSDQLEALVAQGETVDPATAEWPVFIP